MNKTQIRKALEQIEAFKRLVSDLEAGASVAAVRSKYRFQNPDGFDALIRIYERNNRGAAGLRKLREQLREMESYFAAQEG